MISPHAKLSIRELSLSDIIVDEYQPRYLDKLLEYIKLLKEHPLEYAGILFVTPSSSHPGTFALLDGYTRFCANIMTGRRRVLTIVVEEPIGEID